MLRKSIEDKSDMLAHPQSQHWEAEARVPKFKVTVSCIGMKVVSAT